MFHRNGDPDALGSAVALASVFPGMVISTSGGLNLAAKNISAHYDPGATVAIADHTAEDIEEFDLAVILDTSNPALLEHMPPIPKVVIDHHAYNPAWDQREDVLHYHSDPGKRSCAEIIYHLLRRTGYPIPPLAITMLLAGILTDTGHLTFAAPETLITMAEILGQSEVSLEEVHNALNTRNENYSKRIAKLKAAQRLKLEEHRGVLITSSEVNAFEGDAARALLQLGGDVAFVASTRKEEYRISGRANPSLVKRGVHLGTFLGELGAGVNGEGGGHAGAAGLNGTGDAAEVLHLCCERFKEVIRQLPEPGTVSDDAPDNGTDPAAGTTPQGGSEQRRDTSSSQERGGSPPAPGWR